MYVRVYECMYVCIYSCAYVCMNVSGLMIKVEVRPDITFSSLLILTLPLIT